MNIIAGMETFLYVISSALFYPVIAGLVFLTFWMMISFGGFLREYLERKQGRKMALDKFKKRVELECTTNSDSFDICVEKRLQESELELIKSLDKIRFAIRVGPALGLMGTLIPMGIALSALAQGDMPKMAGNMVTAFTTTVVGLACGLLAYLMSLVKEKWIKEDINEMEYFAEMMIRSVNPKVNVLRLEANDEIFEETEEI